MANKNHDDDNDDDDTEDNCCTCEADPDRCSAWTLLE
jgi:hypothetical protein